MIISIDIDKIKHTFTIKVLENVRLAGTYLNMKATYEKPPKQSH